MLDDLVAGGYVLALATAKPEVTARRIIEHFGLTDRFAVLAGATFEPGRRTKAEVIAHALRELAIEGGPHVVMVGDRDHDVHGAHAHGIATIGVLWGYGSAEELTLAGAAALAERAGRRRGPRRRRDRRPGVERICAPAPRTSSVTTRMATGLDTNHQGRPTRRAPASQPATRSGADRFMRRLLRLPVDAPPGSAEGARKAFQTSLVVATFRCLLMYIVFPFVLPGRRAGQGRRAGHRPGHQHRRDGLHRDEHAPLLAGRSPQALVVRRPRRHRPGVPRGAGRPGLHQRHHLI